MTKKLRKKDLILVGVFFLVISIIQASLISGYSFNIVWEDNFNDGDFDGWTLSCIHQDTLGIWANDTETGCTVVNDQLYFTSGGSPWWNPTEYNYTRLWRSTTVLNGSWSWDMYPGHQPCGAAFITKL